MAKTKNEKGESLKEIQALLKESKDKGSVALVRFDGLTVAEVTGIRRALREDKVSYAVVKKTLAKKALTESGVAGAVPELNGQIGMAWSMDQIAPARRVYEFQKKLEKKIELVGGIFEGKFMAKEDMVALAMIPPRQTLLAQFVNVINSPIQGLATALDGIAKKKEGAPVGA